MLLVRQNPRGGPKLREDSFPITEENGLLGYKIGYLGPCSICGRSSGESVLVRTIDAQLIADRFGSGIHNAQAMLNKINAKPKIPFRQRIFIWFFGKRAYMQLKEDYERGDLNGD